MRQHCRHGGRAPGPAVDRSRGQDAAGVLMARAQRREADLLQLLQRIAESALAVDPALFGQVAAEFVAADNRRGSIVEARRGGRGRTGPARMRRRQVGVQILRWFERSW